MNKRLILVVDRDDDLGRKTKFQGPVIGVKDIENAAVALLKSDPNDTDANTMFAAIKLFDEIKTKNKAVATITGAARTGFESDEQVAEQLEKVIEKTKAKEVILITDGAEDEYVLPIIQSRIKVSGIKKVNIKSSGNLKGVYYSAIEFLNRLTEEPKLARLVLGLPGVAALIYAFYGEKAWRLIAGITGTYLLLKGMQLESVLDYFVEDFKKSYKKMRLSFYTYLISILLIVLGTVSGITTSGGTESTIIATSSFAVGSLYFYIASGLSICIGKIFDSYPDLVVFTHWIQVAVTLSAVGAVARAVSQYIIDATIGLTHIFNTTLVGLIVVIMYSLFRNAILRWKL